MNWLKKIIIIMAWPKIKKILLSNVNSEKYQKLIVTKANKKVDIPGIPERSEEKLFNEIYDATQEATTEMINGIDIEEAIERIL
ncbi:MAG: hypothetical protein ACOC80_14835 [Petrotogales bacterium]